jgi:hypothetical protein
MWHCAQPALAKLYAPFGLNVVLWHCAHVSDVWNPVSVNPVVE